VTERRPCTLDDLLDLESLSDPQSTPDGGRVAVVVTRRDPEEDRDRSHVEAVDLTSGERVPLTRGPADRSPRWSPDGRWLAFLRGEDGPPQVWLLPTTGGEARALTELPLGVGELSWSPDSSRVAVTAPEVPEQAQPHDPVVVTRLVSKADGMGRLGPMTVHAHVIDAETRAMTRLTSGYLVGRDVGWAPDGDRLVLVTALHETRDLDAVTHLFEIDAEGGELRQLTRWSGSAGACTWSPDGSTVVFAGSAEPLESGHTRLWRVPAAGGVPEQVLPDLDRNVMVGGPGYPGARPRVTADGEVVFCLRDRGAVHLVAAPLSGGEARTLVGGEVVVSGASHDPLVCLVADRRSTADLHVVRPEGTKPLTRTNAVFFDEVAVAEPQPRTFRAPDGLEVHGWLTGVRGDGPQPLLLDIHGGPHNAWGPSFDPVHAYHQLLAAQGWAVLTPNPRGSDGYGEKFWRAARGAWGLADGHDYLSAVDALVADGTADPDQVAVTGYSYGGYMTCWLTTVTDRFAAAAPGGVVTDLVSFAGTADVAGLLDRAEYGALAAEDPELLRRMSPLTHVGRVRTPTLVLQGAADDRCPVGQAEQWFTALRTLGREVEMVLYPEGSHLFILSGRPSHRADWNARIVEWVIRHTTG
jgi:dipeptidyl aminopeptidase/acylaminoacyl peptidase